MTPTPVEFKILLLKKKKKNSSSAPLLLMLLPTVIRAKKIGPQVQPHPLFSSGMRLENLGRIYIYISQIKALHTNFLQVQFKLAEERMRIQLQGMILPLSLLLRTSCVARKLLCHKVPHQPHQPRRIIMILRNSCRM